MEYVYIAISIYIFTVGACIGSFLNVVSSRIYFEKNFLFGRSHCPKCKVQIKVYDLIPIFSYIFLGGKCRNCKEKISIRYFLVEFILGGIYLICFTKYNFSFYTIYSLIIVTILFAVTLIDFDTMEIPNSLNLILFIIGLFGLLLKDNSIFFKIIGFFAISVPMLILIYLIKDCFGGGDIKLIAGLGLILGFDKVLLCTFLALVFGGSVGIYLLISKKAQKGQHIPFGPYICMGGVISLLFGSTIINQYLSFFGLI